MTDPTNTIQQGQIIIVAAPSGGGKTTLVRNLLSSVPQTRLAVSWTTRSPRRGEVDGEHYHFVNQQQFLSEQQQGGFLEWAKVHDNYYGTPKSQVIQLLNQGFDVLLEIDYQGAAQVRAAIDNVYSIFVLPPSYQLLESRLRARSTDSAEVINKRLSVARAEVAEAKSFDYWVINDHLEQAAADLQSIVRANRLRRQRQQARYQYILDDFSQLKVC